MPLLYVQWNYVAQRQFSPTLNMLFIVRPSGVSFKTLSCNYFLIIGHYATPWYTWSRSIGKGLVSYPEDIDHNYTINTCCLEDVYKVHISVTSNYRQDISIHPPVRPTVCSAGWSWWHQRIHQSCTSLALCEGNPPVTGGFPSQSASNAEIALMSWRPRMFVHILEIDF